MKTKLLPFLTLLLTLASSVQIVQAAGEPVINSVTISARTSNAITFSINIDPIGVQTTTYIQWNTSGNFAAALNTYTVGTTSSATTFTPTIIPLNAATTYYFRVYSENNLLQATYASVVTASTSSINSLVTAYNFNNALTNALGNVPFATNISLSYVTDRHGNANAALNINGNGTTAAIANLPLYADARTISIWVKSNLSNGENHVFSYGGAATNRACGLAKISTNLHFYGYANDLIMAYNTAPTNWTHYALSFAAGGVAKIYVNGVLQASGTITGWFTQSSVFRLGQDTWGFNYFIGAVDDLKIYSGALSDDEIYNLYTANSINITTKIESTKAIKASIYPNPASTVLNIETEKELLAVEIYDLMGKKIISTNNKQVNVSSLAKGIYNIRIVDNNQAVSTQKLMIK